MERIRRGETIELALYDEALPAHDRSVSEIVPGVPVDTSITDMLQLGFHGQPGTMEDVPVPQIKLAP